MILLTETRKDAYGHFEFGIEADGTEVATTSDALKAAKILFNMGVERPFQFVEHARDWGSVEITVHSPEKS